MGIHYDNIFVQVGTETNPFQHSATITLHGAVEDPEIPLYGAKACLGMIDATIHAFMCTNQPLK